MMINSSRLNDLSYQLNCDVVLNFLAPIHKRLLSKLGASLFSFYFLSLILKPQAATNLDCSWRETCRYVEDFRRYAMNLRVTNVFHFSCPTK